MKNIRMRTAACLAKCLLIAILAFISFPEYAAADLDQIRDKGVLRHLGVPYAHFVTGSGDGFSTDLMKGFAKELGVRYEYVETNWKDVIPDLIGKKFELNDGEVTIKGTHEQKGDMIANGLTILPWRKKLLNYSTPTFPSGIWLIARADAPIQPIKPSKDINTDISQVKALLKSLSVLCMSGTCLDAILYELDKTDADLIQVSMKMNEFAPAIINQRAQASLLDVADALIALEKWPGKIKIIGPLSLPQEMGVGFRKEDTRLLARFNEYLIKIHANGRYMELVKHYYPDISFYFPDFFSHYE